MTLLVRNEADIVDAQIAFHLSIGVDFVIATDNRSDDGTTEVLERYAREGVLHLIREDGDDYRQSEWVTRMARLAATDFAADWVINSDADEFWLPRCGSVGELLGAVPDHIGVVRGAFRNFVPRPESGLSFAERMTVRHLEPTYRYEAMATVFKSMHRASADVRVGRGNHEAFEDGLTPLRGWYPIEIFHFPVRAREQCRRKYVVATLTLQRNPDKGIGAHLLEAFHADAAGRFDEFYEPLVASDDEVAAGIAEGRYAVDERLRDALRRLERPGGAEGYAPRPESRPAVLGFPSLEDRALFAAEVSVIPESELALALGDRVDAIERRLGQLERRSWPVRRVAALRRH